MYCVQCVVWFVFLCHFWTVYSEYYQGNINGDQSFLPMPHILQDEKFWETFSDEVLNRKTWKCPFPKDVLTKNMEEDAKLYQDATVFRNRRYGVQKWLRNDSLWAEMVYGASKEVVSGVRGGRYTRELERYNLMEALTDYLYHLHYFMEVAHEMGTIGKTVVVNSQRLSTIHDIDKLDPVMLVGYSERFEDNMTTSLWDICVDRHTHINPHHQAHCLWQSCCQLDRTRCEVEGSIAIREMICDKVSRRVQKNLDGIISREMWDVEMIYYKGLPDHWLDKVENITEELKRDYDY